MKRLALLALIPLCMVAHAQRITWQPIGSNAPAPMAPMQGFNIRGGINTPNYIQQGNTIITNDGRAYQSNGNNVIGTDGTVGTTIGQTTYLRGPDGVLKKCTKYGENVFCE